MGIVGSQIKDSADFPMQAPIARGLYNIPKGHNLDKDIDVDFRKGLRIPYVPPPARVSNIHVRFLNSQKNNFLTKKCEKERAITFLEMGKIELFLEIATKTGIRP